MTKPPISYSLLREAALSGGQISLRGIYPEDVESIRQWRNSQKSILRQNEDISIDQQVEYFRTKVWPEMHLERPSQILLAIESAAGFIGYGGLVNISWANARAELSFLLSNLVEENGAQRDRLFFDFLEVLKNVAFTNLGLNRLFTETYEFRVEHIGTLERAGFRLEGELRQHVQVGSTFYSSLLHSRLSAD